MTQDDVKQLSWEHLAGKLGVSRQGLVLWRKLPDAPTDRDQAKWETFIKEKGLGVTGPKSGSALKEEKLRHEIALLKAKLDREEKRVYEADEVHRVFMHIGTDFKGEVTRLMESELPPKLDGLSAVQMIPILRDAGVTLLKRAAGAVERFYANQ